MFCFIVYLISISYLRFLRQRKTEVRRNKLRHLLKPAHFIRYGRSKHVQNIITTIKKYRNDAKSVRKFYFTKITLLPTWSLRMVCALQIFLIYDSGISKSANPLKSILLTKLSQMISIRHLPFTAKNSLQCRSSFMSIASFISSTYGRL